MYLPACVNRIFGHARGAERDLSLPEALVAVSERAGLPVWIPPDVAGHCCGTPWSSKGYRRGSRVHGRSHRARRCGAGRTSGSLPVVIDASSCALGLIEDAEGIEVLDSIAWAHDRLLPELTVRQPAAHGRRAPVVRDPAHGPDGEARAARGRASPTTSSCRALRRAAASPATAGCCTRSCRVAATADEAAELRGRDFDAHLCSNRTCEIGLQQGTGATFESFVFALEQATRPAVTKP